LIEDVISLKAQTVLDFASENNIKHADALEFLFPKLSIEHKLRIMREAMELWLMTKISLRTKNPTRRMS